MKYFTFRQIIYSVIVSYASGIFFGCIYYAFDGIVKNLKGLFLFPKDLLKLGKMKKKEIISEYKSRITLERKGVIKQFTDFILILLFGIIFINVIYLSLDGIFRVYMLLFVLAGFASAHKTISKIFNKLMEIIFELIYKTVFSLCAVVYIPVCKILRKL